MKTTTLLAFSLLFSIAAFASPHKTPFLSGQTGNIYVARQMPNVSQPILQTPDFVLYWDSVYKSVYLESTATSADYVNYTGNYLGSTPGVANSDFKFYQNADDHTRWVVSYNKTKIYFNPITGPKPSNTLGKLTKNGDTIQITNLTVNSMSLYNLKFTESVADIKNKMTYFVVLNGSVVLPAN